MKPFRTSCALLALAGLAPQSDALTFNFVPAPGTPVQAIAGFVQAGNHWSAIFDDPITVNIAIEFSALPPGVLGQAGSSMAIGQYNDYKPGFIADATSSADAVAVAHLPGSSTVGALMNHTAENGNSGSGYMDNNGSYNNTYFLSTTAQAKALGLWAPHDPSIDAQIGFSSLFPFDFDRGDGITGGFYDFVGVAIHEIGHAMGFTSGVDNRDFFPGLSEDTIGLEQTLMDLFRFTPGVVSRRDWTTDNRPKYFSYDGGATFLGQMATGINFGDGTQASHWKDSLGLGIMDPTAAPGELLITTAADITALDVLGWTLHEETPVPEAGTIWAGLTLGSMGLWHIRRRNRK